MKKEQTTKRILIGVVTGLILILVATVVISTVAMAPNNKNEEHNTSQGEDGEYQSYVVVDSEELSGMLASGNSFFLFVGRPTCPYCMEFSPLLEEVIRENSLLVYHYNTDDGQENGGDLYGEILTKLNVSGVPVMMRIENGERASELGDYTSTGAILNFLRSY